MNCRLFILIFLIGMHFISCAVRNNASNTNWDMVEVNQMYYKPILQKHLQTCANVNYELVQEKTLDILVREYDFEKSRIIIKRDIDALKPLLDRLRKFRIISKLFINNSGEVVAYVIQSKNRELDENDLNIIKEVLYHYKFDSVPSEYCLQSYMLTIELDIENLN